MISRRAPKRKDQIDHPLWRIRTEGLSERVEQVEVVGGVLIVPERIDQTTPSTLTHNRAHLVGGQRELVTVALHDATREISSLK